LKKKISTKKLIIFAFLLISIFSFFSVSAIENISSINVKITASGLEYFHIHYFSDGLARVQTGDSIHQRHGFINKTGELVIPNIYQWAGDFSHGLAVVFPNISGEVGIIDKTGKEIIPIKNGHYINLEFSEGLARFPLNEKWVFINKTGNAIILTEYDYVENFSEGMAAVCIGRPWNFEEDKKWGFIDKAGNEVIPPIYGINHLESNDGSGGGVGFREGLASVRLDDKWGVIDKTGKEVVPFIYDYISWFNDGMAAVRIGDWQEGKWGFIDKTGKEVIPLIYDYVEIVSEGMIAVNIGTDYVGTLDWSYEVLGGKWGFIDTTGKEVIPPKYDSARPFNEGLALVSIGEQRSGSKYGYIDKMGNEVVPIEYDVSGWFGGYKGYQSHERLIAMKKDGKWDILEIQDIPKSIASPKTGDSIWYVLCLLSIVIIIFVRLSRLKNISLGHFIVFGK